MEGQLPAPHTEALPSDVVARRMEVRPMPSISGG
jgi:hypothetical protein